MIWIRHKHMAPTADPDPRLASLGYLRLLDGGVEPVAHGRDVQPRLPLQLGVLVAEEPRLFPQRERITGDELARAGRTPKALQVEDPVLGAHDVVTLAEGAAALVALGPKEADVVLLAVGLSVPHEAGAVLVQEHLTLRALQHI